MVIPFNKVPFKIAFSTGGRYVINSATVKFTDDINDLNERDYESRLSIRENNDFFVTNLSSEKVIMRIEGFEEDFEIEGQKQIFSFSDFPLVPGYYLVTFVSNSADYYTILEIEPSQISVPQWKLLQKELIEDVKNLAFDLVKCNLENEYGQKGAFLDRTVFYQFKVIDDMFGQVMHALADLSSTANVKIKKEYREVPASKAYQEDVRTIMFRQRHPNQTQTKLVLVKHLSYDLPENRFLKKVIIDLSRVIKDFITQVNLLTQGTLEECKEMESYNRTNTDRYRVLKSTLDNALSYQSRAKRIREAIILLQRSEWFQEVDMPSTEAVSMTVLMDSRYRVLYKLYRALNKHKAKYSLSEYYTLRWKRTDQLYELWGFIQVYKSLLKDGFRLVDGLNFISVSDDFVFEDIKAGKSLLLSRNDEVIRLVYNGEIPTKSEDSDLLNNPFFTTGSNKTPDCCIDCYRYVEGQKQYFHSIVIDCKYRKFRNVWESERSSSKHQIKSYKNDTSTLFHKDLSQSKSLRTIKPVLEVMILYPDSDQMQWDEGVRFVSLIPGEESLLKEHLSQTIKDIYE